MNPETLTCLFFLIRLYTALITLGAGIVIYLYSRLVKNPAFAVFVRKFWILLLILGIQGLWAIPHASFPLTDDNVIFVVVIAAVKSWIFFNYLPTYLKQKHTARTPYDETDIAGRVERAQNILL